MPLFHSNAVQVGWAPSLVTPCAVGLGRRFSASGWLPDIRRYGSTYFNYTGKPLAYLLAQPEQADDADNTLRVAFGNEGSPGGRRVVRAALRRRGDRRVRRDRGWRRGQPRCRAAGRCARSRARPRAGRRRRRQREAARPARRARARAATPRSASARSSTRRASVRSRATTTTTTRPRRRRASAGTGRATSATRTPTASSTSRAATPTGSASTARTSRPARSRRRCASAPGVVLAAVYGVPDDQAGDQVMAGLVLADGVDVRPGRVRGLARRARRTSARSGGRATCASCAIRRPPARTRS